MRLLSDENFPSPSVEALGAGMRAAVRLDISYDVYLTAELNPSVRGDLLRQIGIMHGDVTPDNAQVSAERS